MVLTVAVTRIDDIGVGVHVDLFTARSGEREVAGRVLLDLLVDLNFELHKFLFDFVVDVSLVLQEAVSYTHLTLPTN